jgi:glutaredoxin
MRYTFFIYAAFVCAVFGHSPLRAQSPEPISLSSEQKPILYGTAWCPYCKAARNWFKANRVAFVNCDVEVNKNCRDGYLTLRKNNGVAGVPAIVYRGQIWGGYDESQMFEIAELIDSPQTAPPK